MTDKEVKRRTVYCITKKVSDDNYDMYVGWTCQTLSERFSQHKYQSKTHFCKDSRFYHRFRDVGPDNWNIKPLFVYTCSEDEMKQFEKKWIEILDADLNVKSPILDDKRKRDCTVKLYKRNLAEKKYYCEVCEKGFQSKWELNQHKDSLKHQFTFFNSLD